MKPLLFLLLLYSLGTGTQNTKAQAQEIPPPAYQIAAAHTEIPATVLYAIALQESGRSVNGKHRPWPWTLNISGQGYYFDTQEAACSRLTTTLKTTSAKRIDVGLGQINVGYHSHRVEKPCDLLNPYVNLALAGQILAEQHRPGQDWLITMGKYHSPANGAAAARYRAAIQRHYAQLLPQQPPQRQSSLSKPLVVLK
ncbi:lytic transglycosylase domain-containing protein [Saezia sanguinis]|uniref:lytic transglycosylase domain-containing protein n=1 Tax=Saezia sanguinis TaxID=1965230 RepID=UPI00303DA5CF